MSPPSFKKIFATLVGQVTSQDAFLHLRPGPAPDGKYRRITVKLNNGISAKLEHRDGYYADKVWGKFNSQEVNKQIRNALDQKFGLAGGSRGYNGQVVGPTGPTVNPCTGAVTCGATFAAP